jgi:hypothetical protein
MSRRDLFLLGSKWIGIYYLGLAAGELFRAFPLTFTYAPELRQSVVGFTVSHWLSFVGPIGFIALGIFLIRQNSYILKFVFEDDSANIIENSTDFAEIFVKVYGLYLVAGAIPSCIWLLANALIVLGAAPYLSVEDQLGGIRTHLLPILTTVGLGLYCFVWSRKLVGFAFHRLNQSAP